MERIYEPSQFFKILFFFSGPKIGGTERICTHMSGLSGLTIVAKNSAWGLVREEWRTMRYVQVYRELKRDVRICTKFARQLKTLNLALRFFSLIVAFITGILGAWSLVFLKPSKNSKYPEFRAQRVENEGLC